MNEQLAKYPDLGPQLETEPRDLSLLFDIARSSRDCWIDMENMFYALDNRSSTRRRWEVDNSPIEKYSEEYDLVALSASEEERPQEIEETLESIIEQKGQAVVILYGLNYNLLEKMMRRVNEPGKKKKLIVITVGLQEHRYSPEQFYDSYLGRYHVGGSIGLPETFEALHNQLESLVAEGEIDEPFADFQMSRMVGGWFGTPLGPYGVKNIFNLWKTADRGMIEYAHYEDIQKRWNNLSEEEQNHLFVAYQKWLAGNVLFLANPKGYLIYGEMPKDVQRFFEVYFSRDSERVVYEQQEGNTRIRGDFMQPEKTKSVVGHVSIHYPVSL